MSGKTHIIVGDTQVREGVPTKHLSWVGQYIAEQFGGRENVNLIHVGDHADMPSLSSYDKGKKSMEGRRYRSDIDSANRAWDLLNEPIRDWGRRRHRKWDLAKFITLGNHENRINRAVEDDAQLEGVISTDDLNFADWGWNVIPFLEVLELDGIAYSHYFANPKSSKPYSGENLLLRLKVIGRSFTMGHQQGLDVAARYVGKNRHMAMVLGSTYLHDEGYATPQGNNYWRGIVVCHQVANGQYDRMEVSLPYLCERFEGVSLATYMRQYAKEAA